MSQSKGASPLAEEWRGAPGFAPCYIVSSHGRIRNVDTGKLLFGEIDRDGYRRVNLRRYGKALKRRVHRLVCEAFHGPQPEGAECCHLDGNRLHNNAANLTWGSRSENVRHSIDHGTHRAPTPPKEAMRRGARHPFAKLSDELVRAIRRKAGQGLSERSLAREHGMSPGQIHKIISKEAWSHVE